MSNAHYPEGSISHLHYLLGLTNDIIALSGDDGELKHELISAVYDVLFQSDI